MSLLDILDPVKGLVEMVSGLVKNFVPDPTQKLQLQQQALELQTQLTAKTLELQTQLLDAQKSIIVAEATSGSWLEKDWRPLFMLFLAVVIGFVVFNAGHDLQGRPIDPSIIDWVLRISAIGVGGYVGEPVVKALRGGGNGQ